MKAPKFISYLQHVEGGFVRCVWHQGPSLVGKTYLAQHFNAGKLTKEQRQLARWAVREFGEDSLEWVACCDA